MYSWIATEICRMPDRKIDFYKQETANTQAQLYDLMTNETTLEKFAREKYCMKKPNEDVFVIVEE